MHSAASWLRQKTGCRRVAAIGISLGGMMACKSIAEGAAIDDVVLWAVPARGATFVREIRAFALMEDTDAGDTDAQRAELLPEGFIWAGGFVLSAETVADLKALDLSEVALPHAHSQRRALLLDRDGIGPDQTLQAHLESQGVEVTAAPGPGYGAMGPKPHMAVPPLEVYERVLEWLERPPATGADGAPLSRASPVPRPSARSLPR